jgi:hypothetical protein
MLMLNDKGFDAISKTWDLSAAECATIRQSVADNEFFSLQGHYGDDLVDIMSKREVSVRVGDCQKTIRVSSFINRLIDHDAQLKTAKRLLKVWQTGMSLVQLPRKCASFEEEDQKVMSSSDREKEPLIIKVSLSGKTVSVDSAEVGLGAARGFTERGILNVGDTFVVEDDGGKRQKWLLVSASGSNVVIRPVASGDGPTRTTSPRTQ